MIFTFPFFHPHLLTAIQNNSVEGFKTAKRITLKLKLPANDNYTLILPLFRYFLRLPDHLVSSPQFSPNVQKKLTGKRKEEIEKVKKAIAKAEEEERMKELAKSKKVDPAKREKKELKKAQKKRVVRA